MGRFQDEHILILKSKMLRRIPACKFTAEDFKEIKETTGLDDAQIRQWAKDLRRRYDTSKREEYLRQEDENDKARYIMLN